MKEKEPKAHNEKYFLPAALCTTTAPIGFCAGVTFGRVEIVLVSFLIWGAGLAFWRENEKSGGSAPWTGIFSKDC